MNIYCRSCPVGFQLMSTFIEDDGTVPTQLISIGRLGRAHLFNKIFVLAKDLDWKA